MRCRELYKILDQRAPFSLACDWDNSGLLVGSGEKEVKTIFLALDATDEVVECAKKAQADLLLTHHPLIFRPLKRVTDEDFIANRVIRMIRSDMSYIAMHTNYDGAPGCMADLAAERLGLADTKPLQLEGELDGIPYGIGKVGSLSEPATLSALAERVKAQFHLPTVSVFGDLESQEKLTCAAICPGSGGSTIKDAVGLGAQVLITGDIGHHDGIDAVANGLAVIDAGHYGLEHIFMEDMEAYLKKCVGDSIRIIREQEKLPCQVV